MTKLLNYTWPYRLLYLNKAFSLYFNGSMVAVILPPARGRWPIVVTINKKMYSFSKSRLLNKLIEITDVHSNEHIGFINVPVFSTFIRVNKLSLSSGENFTWVATNFFSLRWKWKKDNTDEIEAIDSLVQRSNCGIITVNDYKATTDLLVVTGFFLSLLRRSKLSVGTLGLKRRMLPQLLW
jgi:hypothetical protein